MENASRNVRPLLRVGTTMKKILLISFLVLLCSCSVDTEPEPGTYVLFTLNVHDWVFPENSIDAVQKTIAIHEKYNVPIDIYLNDPTFQNFVENAPELIEELKTSDVVTVSYHFRAPYPCYSGFDNFGLSQISDKELYDTLLEYEKHSLDLETGEYTTEEGGYQFVKDTIGYAPVTVSLATSTKSCLDTLEKIYSEKGAQGAVFSQGETDLGTEGNYLKARPQHVEMKWYEQNRAYMHDDITAESFITESLAEYTGDAEQVFLNLKMHENNYYTQYTPFWPVYWTDNEKSQVLTPPYDITQSSDLRAEDYTESMWEWYEEGVKYITEHPEQFTTVSTQDVYDLV
jgi:hypothetical protein